MAGLSLFQGITSKLCRVFIQSTLNGLGLTGLTSGSSGLTAYYIREGDSSSTVINLSAGTTGTWSSGGFVEVDATHMPGIYEIGITNGSTASGQSVVLYLQGAANMAPCTKEIELTSYPIHKNFAYSNFMVYMVLSSDHLTPATGKTVSGTVSKNGGAFGALSNSVIEVSNGWYKVTLAAADINGTEIALTFTATATDAVNIKLPIAA